MLFKALVRREELRGSTYLEIILVVVLILVLLVFSKEMEINNLEVKIQVEKDELKDQINDLKNKNTELELENIRLRKLLETYRRKFEEFEKNDEEDKSYSAELIDDIAELERQIEIYKTRIAELEKKNDDEGIGNEIPRCRISKENKITTSIIDEDPKSFISIEKLEESFYIAIIDNSIYERIISSIPVLKLLTNKTVFSRKEFQSFGSKIYKETRTKNNCFLFAKIKESSIPLTSDLKFITQYFYPELY